MIRNRTYPHPERGLPVPSWKVTLCWDPCSRRSASLDPVAAPGSAPIGRLVARDVVAGADWLFPVLPATTCKHLTGQG